MFYRRPVTDIIQRRYSCRMYHDRPIADQERRQFVDFIASTRAGPFGAPVRFELAAATEQDRQALKGLGTYGFIKGAAGFIVGAMGPAEKNLEDYGNLMERIILFATDIGLGTCWLGGSFTKSGFARKISATAKESVPAVTSVGYAVEDNRSKDWVRRGAGADRRLAWEKLFFQNEFNKPLSRDEAGAYAAPLEMVRLGPSASNRQPWRIIKDGDAWHVYMQRTPGYRQNLLSRVMGIADLQRVDVGIAMCHFELAAQELGLKGEWVVNQPAIAAPDELTEYTVSWIGKP